LVERAYRAHVVTPARRRLWLHALLFAMTAFTTLVIGARLQYDFNARLPAYAVDEDLFPWLWALREPRHLLLGIPFSLALMSILTAHELGHYFYCRRYRVVATPPLFIPAPTLIGTLGAFIRIKSPIPDRRALFDIGIAGPIAGFVVALPTLIVGLLASRFAPDLVAQQGITYHYPLIFQVFHWAMPWSHYGSMHVPLSQIDLHPVALAAWVGMFMTSLNLIPAGQLDGGHILYALAPRWHRNISRALIIALIPLGVFLWSGWLLWATLLTAFTRHPAVPRD